jgi:hypothetical protein
MLNYEMARESFVDTGEIYLKVIYDVLIFSLSIAFFNFIFFKNIDEH